MNVRQKTDGLGNRLTNEQRELAAKNHNLIYAYANKRNISIDEYYDVLAIGLCKAAKAFDKDKGSFSTICFKCMENEMCNQCNAEQKKSSVPNNLVSSYDAPQKTIDSDNQLNLSEKIVDFKAGNAMSYAIMYSEFISNLNAKEKIIVQCLLNGYTHNEIANIFKCKQQNISYFVRGIRKKLSEYLHNS